MSDRGSYRAIHSVTVDSPEFIDMGWQGQLVWFHLKLRLGPSGIGVLPAIEAVLGEATGGDRGCHPDTIRQGITDGMNAGFLVRERNVLWLRNALKFEPSMSLKNENHRKRIQKHIAGLPKLKIVNDFADYYGLDRPFEIECHPDGIPQPIPDQGEREEQRKGRTEYSLAAREAVLGFDTLDAAVRTSIKGLYGLNGTEGTDEGVWSGIDDRDERRRLVEVAVVRWQAEGHSRWNSRLFRRILETVVDESRKPVPSDPSIWDDD